MELGKILNIPIVSEEDVNSQSNDRPDEYWLIDPIDGTASFAYGFSGFVCQVALIRDKQPQLAGVYAPALDKLYMAVRGQGATLNGHRIQVKVVNRRELTLVDNYPQPKGLAKFIFNKFHCESYLESGSIGLKICLVAEGVADIFSKDVCVRDWDVAAPHLILQEAGGVLTQFRGEPFDYQGSYERCGLVATSSEGLLSEVNELIATYGCDS